MDAVLAFHQAGELVAGLICHRNAPGAVNEMDFFSDAIEHRISNRSFPGLARLAEFCDDFPRNRMLKTPRAISSSGVDEEIVNKQLPAQFISQRKKVREYPGPEPEVWTERNNYPALGIIQTSPTELSIYWTEHFRHPGIRLRRGTLRLDGFVSVHAGGTEGELLTRPFVFKPRAASR